MLIVSSPGVFTAMPSAIVKPEPSGQRPGRLHADDPDAGLDRAQRKRDPGREPAAADRDHGSLDLRHLIDELEPDRPLPGHDHRILERVHERRAVLLHVPTGVGETVFDRVAAEDDLRAVVARRVDLRHRRVLWHVDPRMRADLERRPGHRLAVVTRARSDDAGGALLRARAPRCGCTRRGP